MAEAQAIARVDARRWFYHWMALTCLGVAVLGFMPTFFVPLAQGTAAHPPMTYMHGLLFFGWTIFFCVQTWFAASGWMLAHREWGLLGVALATAMGFSVLIVALTRLHDVPPRTPQLVLNDVSGVIFFEVCVAAALANARRPETHKRFMLLGTVYMLGAPIGRWYGLVLFALLGPQALAVFTSNKPPSFFEMMIGMGPPLIAGLLILVAMAFDWQTRRRVSPIYAIGLPAMVLMGPVVTSLGFAAPWVAAIDWLRGFGG